MDKITIIDRNKGAKCLVLDDFKYRKFRMHNAYNIGNAVKKFKKKT